MDVAPAAPATLHVVFERAVAACNVRHARDRQFGERRSTEIGVQDDTRRVDRPRQRRHEAVAKRPFRQRLNPRDDRVAFAQAVVAGAHRVADRRGRRAQRVGRRGAAELPLHHHR